MNLKLKGKATVGSLAVLAVLAGSALIPSASADTNGGKFHIKATNDSSPAFWAIRPGLTPGEGGGEVTPEPTPEPTPDPTPEPTPDPTPEPPDPAEEAAAAEWTLGCDLPDGNWQTVGAGANRFAIHDGRQGGYSTDGCTWNVRPLQNLVVGAGEIAYSGIGVFFVANPQTSSNTQSASYSYSMDKGDTWTVPTGNVLNATKLEGTRNGFVAPRSTSSTPSAGKVAVAHQVGAWIPAIIAGKPNPASTPSLSRPLYTPIDAIAASPTQDIVVVAESGRDRETNYVKVGTKTMTVAEAGYGRQGLLVGTGTVNANMVWNEGPAGDWSSVDWTADGFLAISRDGSTVAKSANGTSWTTHATNLGAGYDKVVKNGNEYTALKRSTSLAAGGKLFAKSTDGINWTRFNISTASSWSDIAVQNGCLVAINANSQDNATTCKK